MIATFGVLYALGYSINIFTLLALVLAIGIVVDDAIVVLENIYRNIEEGLTPFDASIKTMHEIGFAIVTITLSLVAVFSAAGIHRGIDWTFAFGVCCCPVGVRARVGIHRPYPVSDGGRPHPQAD